MATTHTITTSVVRDGVSTSRSKDYSNNGSHTISGETVADSATDQLYTLAIDVSAVTSFYLVSDQALTVETNSGGSPADTIVLVAGVEYKWTSDSYDSFLLGTDVTALYFTNASGSTATVYLECIFDGSP